MFTQKVLPPMSAKTFVGSYVAEYMAYQQTPPQ